MSDEQIIEALEKIQAYCGEQHNCFNCQFRVVNLFGSNYACQLSEITELLRVEPSAWGIGKIKEVLEK